MDAIPVHELLRRTAVYAAAFAVSLAALFTPGLASPASRTAVAVHPEAAPSELRVREEWVRAIFGDGIGVTGLNVTDLDGSGDLKIVAAAAPRYSRIRYWYVLSASPSGYEQEWVSPYYTDDITALRTADLDGVPGAEIVVATGDTIELYDGSARELVRSIQTEASPILGLRVADVDGDGEPELAFCGPHPELGSGFHVYDVATGLEEYSTGEYECSDVAVGELDGDSSPEIVLGSRESAGYVLDGSSRLLEWTYHAGFGELVRTGDVDGDGLDEIVAGAQWAGFVTIYDADLRSPTWEIPIDIDLAALQVLDVEGDGDLEIVYGDGQWGEVYTWDPRVRALEWSVPNPEHGVTDVAVGDTDGDGVNELLWAAGYTSSGPDYLYVASTATHEVEWRSQDVRGPFRALDFGDVDHDGEPELLYVSASSDSGYDGGILFIHDARTKALEHRSGPLASFGYQVQPRIRIADVDGDPQAELVLSIPDSFDGRIVCLDGHTFAEQWSWLAPGDFEAEDVHSLEIGDVDGDGELEVVAGLEQHVHVLDAATGAEEWRSTALGFRRGTVTFLRLADVDADPNLEIVAAQQDGQVFVYDGVTHVQELQTADLGVTALATADRDGDGTAEILIGTRTVEGTVAALDPSTGAVGEVLGEYGGPIDALAVIDLTDDFVPDLVLAVGNELLVHDGRFPSERLWRSGVIGDGVGLEDSLRVADLDEDGRLEILANLGSMGLRIFEVEGTGAGLPPGPFLETPELPGFRFKVRITAGDREIAGGQAPDCIDETLCVSGALAGRSELFLRVIGPRPNGFLWLNLVRFTPSRVEVWVEQTASGQVNYYDLPPLASSATELSGLVDKLAFLPRGDAAARSARVRSRAPGDPGVSWMEPGSLQAATAQGGGSSDAATFTADAFPGFAFTVRILAGGQEQPVRPESECLAETVCVSGAVPGRSELFLRLIGPRPNGYLWVSLVRFTPSRVEVEIEQLATGLRRTYVLDQVPSQSDQLPGRIDREAFLP